MKHLIPKRLLFLQGVNPNLDLTLKNAFWLEKLWAIKVLDIEAFRP